MPINKIMLVSGIFFLIITVAFFSPVYQWFSAASFLFGVFLIVVGSILHFESFTLKIPSREGWGTILICVSALLMASAAMVIFFAEPGAAYIMPTSFRPGAKKIVLVTLTRPIAWLAPILGWISIGLLAFGVMLKFFRDIF